MRHRMSAASACLLVGSLLIGAMGLLWLALFAIGLVVGAGVGSAAVAGTVFDVVDIPSEVVWTGGSLYAGLMAIATVLSLLNLVGGGLGLFAAVRGFWGRTWGLRTAAVLQIAMALIFGLPGLITMNPLALVWAAVLALAIATLVVAPRGESLDEAVVPVRG